MQYLVSGASGFLGTSLLELFRKRNISYRVLGRKRKGPDWITYEEFLRTPINGAETIFCHLAGRIVGTKMQLVKTNHHLSKSLLDKALQDSFTKFVFVSSFDVEVDPHSNYSVSKLMFERELRSSAIDHLILRPSVCYGRGDKNNFGKVVQMINWLPVVPLPNNGQTLFRPIDVIEFWNCYFDKLADKTGTFTIASQHVLSFESIVRTFALNMSLPRIFVKIPLNLGMPKNKTELKEIAERKVILLENNLLDWTRHGL